MKKTGIGDRKNPGSKCVGVDLNRNFPEGYGIGASKNPCSEVYQGEAAKSSYFSGPNKALGGGGVRALQHKKKRYAGVGGTYVI